MGLGNTPFGLGTPIAAATPADQSEQAFCRYIDPNSGDYQIDDANRSLAQMPPVRQRVLIILTTVRGSSSVLPWLGVNLPRKIDESFEVALRNSVRQAFRLMTDIEKSLQINDIIIAKLSSGRVRVTLSYTDLTQADTAPDPVEVLF